MRKTNLSVALIVGSLGSFLLCFFSHTSISSISEVDQDFDALVDLVIDAKLLRRVNKLGGERSLGLILLLFSDQLQFGMTLGHDLLESLLEMLIESQKILLECFSLLLVKLSEEHPDAFFSISERIGLAFKLSVLLEVLLVPFLTVAALSWECVQFLACFMNFLLELCIGQLLATELLEDLNIELTESLHESLCVQLHLEGLINPLANLLNVPRL